MSLSRRRFVHAATLTMLAGAALPRAFAQSGTETIDPTEISKKRFEPLVGESFAIAAGGKSLGAIKLVAVEDVTPVRKADAERFMVGRRTPVLSAEQPMTSFALRFEGQGKAFPQDTYTLHNPRIGSMSMFLVPSGSEADPARYTAIFTLLGTPGRG